MPMTAQQEFDLLITRGYGYRLNWTTWNPVLQFTVYNFRGKKKAKILCVSKGNNSTEFSSQFTVSIVIETKVVIGYF